MHLIIGLGNPGKEYEGTRHNVGRFMVGHFCEAQGFPQWKKDKYANALLSHGEVAGHSVELLLPETFMNKSGESVRHILKEHTVESGNIIVVYDELDLPVGEFKISQGRGSGGHNGVKSVLQAVGSKDFVRVRIGISPVSFFGNMKRSKGERASRFVLAALSRREHSKLDALTPDVVRALETIVAHGVEKAMNTYN